jgi:glycosyltransferase 2 family protein
MRGWRAATWRWLLGAAVLGGVAWHTGFGPFVDGVRALDAQTLALGVGIAVPTTVACAWRWRLVARGLGLDVGLGPAVAAYYRSQFFNTTLPGGVLGDVHRGVRHGLDNGKVGRALRAVVWERAAGQVVLVVVAMVVLLLAPSPVRPYAPALLGAVLGVAAGLFLVTRLSRAVRADLRAGPLRAGVWPGVVVASAVAVAGYVATYLVAARAVGVTASVATLLPLVLLVLLAAGLPLNVAGFGPREGMAAWVFGAAGLGVELGVAAAVAYGAMVLVASLPGAAVAVLGSTGRSGAWLSVPTRS